MRKIQTQKRTKRALGLKKTTLLRWQNESGEIGLNDQGRKEVTGSFYKTLFAER